MSGKFRFIHAADLHLGSYLNINGKPQVEIQDLCKNAVYNSFENICNKSILYKVDFILLCGDIYDSYLRSVRGNRFFINQCIRLSENNIGVYVIYGNHDATNEKGELFDTPKNLHILSSDRVESFEVYKEGEVVARIIGKSYKRKSEREKTYEDYLLSNDVFNIAMLHTALEKDDKNYIPCTLEELKMVANIDYFALGHIHKRSILSASKPVIAFSGIPQGRDMGEQGIGGVFLVEAFHKEIISMEFLPIGAVIYKSMEIMIGALDKVENYSDLVKIILEKTMGLTNATPEVSCQIKYSVEDLKQDFKGYIVKLTVGGRTELHSKISQMTEEDYQQLIENINEQLSAEKYFLWIDSISFRTTPLIENFETLKIKNSIFKDLEEAIELYTQDEECKSSLIKNWGSIWKKQIYTENLDEDKFNFDDEIIQDIILQAKELVIEKLAEALDIN